jgi:ribosomal-protein-alanine N-acetyltransferase
VLRTELRKADLSDAPRMGTIAYAAWEKGILPLLSEEPLMRESERRRLSQAAALGWQHAIVAIRDGDLVGWCSRVPRRNYIPYLFVAPDSQMMLELEGAERVHLETPADNVRAVRFYERQGYNIMALRGRDGGVRQSFMSVHLEKRLHPLSGEQERE